MPKHRFLLISICLLAGILLVGFGAHTFRTRATSPEQTSSTEKPVEIINEEKPAPVVTEIDPSVFEYIEIVDSCGPYYENGPCVNVRSGPSVESEKITMLRKGIVLRVEGMVTDGDRIWYKIKFDGWLRYPERITTDWYVAGDYVRVFTNAGEEDLMPGQVVHSKKAIVVSLQKEMLYAYDDGGLFLETPISAGKDEAPTLPGKFTIYRKTPSRYMQGPLPGISDEKYDLPGVPWSMYFTEEGAVIHGAYWHDKFGQPESHGCINVPPDIAERLYAWAEVGMKVVIVD